MRRLKQAIREPFPMTWKVSVRLQTDVKPRILCVEDDEEIARMLVDVMRENGFEATSVGSAPQMDDCLREQGFDLVVLDVMLPGEDGISICRRLRAQSSIPIILLTARNADIDRILGLELGADDYVTKPFNPRELMARLRALLRRAASGSHNPDHQMKILTFSGWRINPSTRDLYDPSGLKITLTGIEFDLLLAFCRNPGKVMSRDQLTELLHGGLVGSIDRSIDVHISRIRHKIEPDPRERSMIKAVRLGGYVFTSEVSVVS
jgi:two-component system OmpR family response regulator